MPQWPEAREVITVSCHPCLTFLPCNGVAVYRTADPKPVICKMARDLGVHHEALRNWIRQDEADRGERDDRLT
ncbi:transposase, partial [Kitasatospora sp. NPDC101155]|uniref:transposase n=1 Tax=Kitasatospora sp. NPDC101155 TaxID=3364097 RepID=UPI00382B6AC2